MQEIRTDMGHLVTRPKEVSKEEKIQQIVDLVSFSDISSIKSVVTTIIRVINNPSSTVKELKDVILLDPPLAAKVLKTANSAYYSRSFSRVFTDIEQAIIWMGSEIIRELALNQKVCEIFDKDTELEGYSRRALWRHSIAVAMLVKMIYRKEFGEKGENAYVVGLLHDMGVIAEDQFFPYDFKKVLCLSHKKKIDIAEAEEEIWGYNHADVGSAICDSWVLPMEFVHAIRYHHSPTSSQLKDFRRLQATLFVADYTCQENEFDYGAAPIKDKKLFRKCLRIMDVSSYALDLIATQLKKEMKEMEDKGVI